jgi:glyoxylase-like metal-dependent hydrolase (beta-lactamase superfamily II)
MPKRLLPAATLRLSSLAISEDGFLLIGVARGPGWPVYTHLVEITKTLTELGGGVLAYTQLPGSWGWSNAGLITDGDQSLLVDTLFDRRLTSRDVDCYGNSVVTGAQIIGSRGCAEDLAAAPPRRNALLQRASRLMLATGGVGRVLARGCAGLGFRTLAWISDAAPFALPLFEDFDFEDNDLVLPDGLFEGRLTLSVGNKRVELWEVGPAHTLGDTVVHVPEDGVLFTGDILFKDAHPVIWQGPVSNWIRACRELLELPVEVVVPGHGPVTDLSGLRETLEYLEWLTTEAHTRYDAGLTVEEAARDIESEAYRNWLDPERIFVNVHTLYRDFSGDPNPPEILEMFAGMARLARYWTD